MNVDRIRTAADERYRRDGEAFGHAVRLLYETGRGKFSVASAYLWIMPAVMHRQVRFAFDADGAPVGFVSWAFVSDQTLARLQRDEVASLEASEWTEGLNVWIVDVVATRRMVPAVIGALKIDAPFRTDRVHGLKRKPDGSIRRIVYLKLRGDCPEAQSHAA